jgi:hypothetical protein
MDIGRQRITAVRKLEVLGYTYRGGEWLVSARRRRREANAGRGG